MPNQQSPATIQPSGLQWPPAHCRSARINSCVVTAQQMQAIEQQLFDGGMPVAALMEKVGGLIAQRVQALYPLVNFPQVGVLVGPGHNGGDALVVARELLARGYQIRVCRPLAKAKALTQAHADYLAWLGIAGTESMAALAHCDVIIDGLFGFGLDRPLTGALAAGVADLNTEPVPILSIDVPSGLHTDTGQPLGAAIQAQHTLCLGLWKQGLLQDDALPYVGQVSLIDFDIPLSAMTQVLGTEPPIQRLTPAMALAALPLERHPTTHKYQQGHLLLIGGSQRYAGSIILAALAARATGVGLLSIAVPESLKSLVVSQVPDAIAIGCPETPGGAIAALPESLNLDRFDAIAYGPGLTQESNATLAPLFQQPRPLLLDADGLNLLAQQGIESLRHRPHATLLTPHLGEFKRLFPQLHNLHRQAMAQQAAQLSHAFILLKGAHTLLASPQGQTLINPESTPALARGGSGDVLTGLIGGLLAQAQPLPTALMPTVAAGIWWHAQAGRSLAAQRTPMGVDAHTLSQSLPQVLNDLLSSSAHSSKRGIGSDIFERE